MTKMLCPICRDEQVMAYMSAVTCSVDECNLSTHARGRNKEECVQTGEATCECPTDVGEPDCSGTGGTLTTAVKPLLQCPAKITSLYVARNV